MAPNEIKKERKFHKNFSNEKKKKKEIINLFQFKKKKWLKN